MKHLLQSIASTTLLLALMLAQVCASSPATSTFGKQVLVVADKGSVAQVEKDYSQFWSQLKKRDFNLTFADVSTAELFKYGQKTCDNLIMFSPEVQSLGGSGGNNSKFSASDVIAFVGQGGNVLLTASSTSGSAVRKLALEFGFELDPSGTLLAGASDKVVDKSLDAEYGSGSGNMTVIKVDVDSELPFLTKSGGSGQVLFHGIGHRLVEHNNLVFPGLKVDSNSVDIIDSKTGTKKKTTGDDKDNVLVGLSQARNNARVLFTGSMAMFSDKFMKADGQSGNAQVVTQLTSWLFQEVGQIRVKSANHHRLNEKKPLKQYRIKDPFVYEIELEELVNGKWRPFQLPSKDDKVQLEFVMLDPFIRTNLVPSQGGKFVTRPDLILPDVHGVYTLKVEYKRRGYSYIVQKDVVSIVPFRHNEYPRFLVAAYPYYASVGLSMSVFILFTMFYLYYQDPSVTSANEGKKKK
ncbi:hypothetical protein MIR68_006387 [Amoeboaphelidium protococcarum]|nr:hypothetical protein MIR68_006387 [Amoeboaphelidium protococcarum]